VQRRIQPDLDDLKRRHLRFDPDEVVLHRADIIAASGPSFALRDPGRREAFDADLLERMAK
jgi:hypothetical protein